MFHARMQVRPIPVLLLSALALLVGGCAEQPRQAEPPDSHQRMLELLGNVMSQAAVDNPFLGLSGRAERMQMLSMLPEDDPRTWMLNVQIGRDDLRLGNLDSALEHHLKGYALMERFRDQIAPEDRISTIFELGLAYLRQGENFNCVLQHTAESCIFPIKGGGVHVLRESSEQAVRYFTEVLQLVDPDSPESLRTRWLLNVALMTLGRYPEGVPEAYLLDPRWFDSDEPFPLFRDIAPRLGVAAFDLSGGAIAEDFDNDGDLDILVSTSDTTGPMHYYRSNGDGTYTDRTAEAGLKGLVGGLNMVQADYDNDGDVDVLVMRGGWWRQFGRHPNSLLRNNGDATFSDVTLDAGLGEVFYPTQTASWADYDNDGDVDLYVGNEYSPEGYKDLFVTTDYSVAFKAPGQLFENNGDGTFTDVAARAGVENNRYAKGVIWGDYDNDRFPDLYVSNLGQANRLYHNNGDGTFSDLASPLGVTWPVSGFATWFWDYDNDGALDLFVASYGGPGAKLDVAEVVAGYLGLPHKAELDFLYKGSGGGRFEEVQVRQGLTKVTFPMGSNFGDLDNDGYPDFFLGTGFPQYSGLMPNLMYHNLRGEGFADITVAGGFGHLQKGHGVVFADLDHDGDQDVYEQIGGAYKGDPFGNVLFENPGFGNHWLKLRLVGVQTNRSAIGVRIRADIVEDGQPRSVYKRVNSGGSFGCSPLGRQELGLGRAERIARLEIYWPTSGRTHVFEDLAADQYLEVIEDRDEFRVLPLPPMAFAGGS